MWWWIKGALVAGLLFLDLVVANGWWSACALRSHLAAEELKLCGDVYTNMDCTEETDVRSKHLNSSRAKSEIDISDKVISAGGKVDGEHDESWPGKRDGIDDKNNLQAKGSNGVASDVGTLQGSWSNELPRAQVLNRTDSFQALEDVGLADIKDGVQSQRELIRRRSTQRSVVGKVIAPDSSATKRPRGRLRESSHSAKNEMALSMELRIGKAPLIKSLKNLQGECKLPGCPPALALEETIELCDSLEVTYKRCREEAEVALAKVVRHKERTRREQQEERRYLLEREKLRQRDQKLALDKMRHRAGL